MTDTNLQTNAPQRHDEPPTRGRSPVPRSPFLAALRCADSPASTLWVAEPRPENNRSTSDGKPHGDQPDSCGHHDQRRGDGKPVGSLRPSRSAAPAANVTSEHSIHAAHGPPAHEAATRLDLTALARAPLVGGSTRAEQQRLGPEGVSSTKGRQRIVKASSLMASRQ